ncbi:MAG: aconitate hydratase AcnA [Candidatus Eisenbacteria bacterium]|uniref:Aconitate hydratase n=1 Tax=Eiseniibacteriota bacterium TaxID=2212470 RepID=A0A948RTR1_UNCEI|nr:aconitate hydratase AcnA [Candidatus Eisenbacteria bacterium]MBU1950062.1 aconitate hydratase AcnA [Candidatus Eisenbacteria bacterium]MBU2689398.1 aconitate hydratase AcnA [Candidatus Eisenbacteria bacterium]
MSSKANPLVSRSRLQAAGSSYSMYRLKDLEKAGYSDFSHLPVTLRILLENLIRHESGSVVERKDIEALIRWDPKAVPKDEISFYPARVVLQDFTGVPALVDFAAMRDAMVELGGDPEKINPLQPADLIIDHSVQVDLYGSPDAYHKNTAREFERNGERYRFLKWGQSSFKNFRVVPPGMGIIHQVNLEHLAEIVWTYDQEGSLLAYPDTLVGTDSHTTMINGLGVMGWGVGGIEAEAAMLGQPISMLIPQVIGFRLKGRLSEGITATDLVITITQILRKENVVGKFVEFFGPGLDSLSLPHRATVANMAPEYGATMGFFPVDEETLDYLRITARSERVIELVRAYLKEQGLFREPNTPEASYTKVIELDISTVEPSMAGPKRPQDRVSLSGVRESFTAFLKTQAPGAKRRTAKPATPAVSGLDHGAVVIAAITSCTNTSNPEVLVTAGLLARNAAAKGLKVKPWVKTSFAPGSRAVSGYLQSTGLMSHLERLGFHLVGYGCTTCIGNSGPLPEEVARIIRDKDLAVGAVLSGNRNFEGRIHPLVKANYLASPPLVVAYALAGWLDLDLTTEPLGEGSDGKPVFLRDIWPIEEEIRAEAQAAMNPELFREGYADLFGGTPEWKALNVQEASCFPWDDDSTYIKRAPYFDGISLDPPGLKPIHKARVLALLGDSVTTDHISPAGAIPTESPAGQYLQSHGIEVRDFNSFGSRRGNHEVMIRGTFGNIRLKNLLTPGVEGGVTVHFPDGGQQWIYDAAKLYQNEGVPLLVIAGKEYGTGSSRDWAAKGTLLLGVRAVIAESYERIHRSNLVGMGVLPLQFLPGEGRESLGLTGHEIFNIDGIGDNLEPGQQLAIRAVGDGGKESSFKAVVRIDTPQEMLFCRHGGILPYVLRRLLKMS